MSATAGAGADATAAAWGVAAEVVDPELPMLTLADLGVLRDVAVTGDGVVVTITPTYSGCPAVAAMAADLRARLSSAGYQRVEVRTVLAPAWSTDRITAEGRRKLAAAGIAPPGPAPVPHGSVAVALTRRPAVVACPRCRSEATEELSAFGPTACTGLRRCTSCLEPFEHVRPL